MDSSWIHCTWKQSLNDVDIIHTACVKLLTCAEPKTKASFSFRFSNFFNLLIYNGWSISVLYYYAMGTALLCFRITMRMIFEKITFQFISTYFSLFQHVSSSFFQFDINSLVTNLFIFTFVGHINVMGTYTWLDVTTKVESKNETLEIKDIYQTISIQSII